jgi:hypothetical protein
LASGQGRRDGARDAAAGGAKARDRVSGWEPAKVLEWAEDQGADLAALRANLALTPAERMAELDAMNRFHAEVQSRTLDAKTRAALLAREIAEAERRLAEVEG